MSRPGAFPPSEPDAVVVFVDEAALAWLRLLKRGFRHCFVMIRMGKRWILYNPMSHQTQFAVLPGMPVSDVLAYFREQGHVALAWRVEQARLRPAPWRPFTCVEAVKRALGLRAPGVLTPWQLYCSMKKSRKTEKSLDNSGPGR